MPVYKDKNRDTWFLQFRYRGPDGKSHTKKERGFRTKKEALQRLKLLSNQSVDSLSLSEFSVLYFDYLQISVNGGTLRIRREYFKSDIAPFFGTCHLTEITPDMILSWQQSLISNGTLAVSTTFQVHHLFSAMFKFAMKFYNFSSNPVEEAGFAYSLPTYRNSNKNKTWTVSDFSRIYHYMKRENYEAALMAKILFFGGMRIGELSALTPQDLNVNRFSIMITKSFKGRALSTSTKTQTSNRELFLPRHLFRELSDFIRIRNISADSAIFGHCIDFLSYHLKKASSHCHIPYITVHGLRHSHASLLLNMGFSPFVIKNRLGHSSIKFTMRVYPQLYQSDEKKLVNQLQVLEKDSFTRSYTYPILLTQKANVYFASSPDFTMIPPVSGLLVENVLDEIRNKIANKLTVAIFKKKKIPPPSSFTSIPHDTEVEIILLSFSF